MNTNPVIAMSKIAKYRGLSEFWKISEVGVLTKFQGRIFSDLGGKSY